jgi:WD40 repeat protein
VTVFDVETKKNMAEFAGANGFSDITFGSTKDLLFVATDTGIAIVDVLKAQTIMTIPAMESPFAVSADGNVLAAVGLKGRLALFDIRSGKEVITLGDVRSSVGMSMSFSKDGQKLAVVVNDYTLEESDVTLYDVPGGGVTDRFNLGGIVRSIFFQRSTEALYVASEIRKRIVVTKIELSAERASQQACALLWRNLKIDEWERYFGGRRYRKTCPNIPEERIQTGVDG